MVHQLLARALWVLDRPPHVTFGLILARVLLSHEVVEACVIITKRVAVWICTDSRPHRVLLCVATRPALHSVCLVVHGPLYCARVATCLRSGVLAVLVLLIAVVDVVGAVLGGRRHDLWRLLQVLLYHVMLGYEVQVLHQALALVVLRLSALNGHDVGPAHTLELLWHAAHLLHVLRLLLVLHQLSLLALLALGLLLLGQESLVLLLVGEVLILQVKVHALQPLVVYLIDLLVYVFLLVHREAVGYALDATIIAATTILLRKIDAVGSHG